MTGPQRLCSWASQRLRGVVCIQWHKSSHGLRLALIPPSWAQGQFQPSGKQWASLTVHIWLVMPLHKQTNDLYSDLPILMQLLIHVLMRMNSHRLSCMIRQRKLAGRCLRWICMKSTKHLLLSASQWLRSLVWTLTRFFFFFFIYLIHFTWSTWNNSRIKRSTDVNLL